MAMPPAAMPAGFNMEANPTEDTEWNDVLRQHGILPAKAPDTSAQTEELLEEARKLQHEQRLDDLEMDELDELEDDEDSEVVQQYRHRRLAEMQETARRKKFDSLLPLSKADYTREVNEASHDCWVFVLLYKDSLVASKRVRAVMTEFARRYGEIKCLAIVADRAIENYPDAAVPTVLCYRDGDMREQFVGLRETTMIQDIERIAVSLQALSEDDVRRNRKRQGLSSMQSNPNEHDDNDNDSDWDS
ncbi:Phosducin-like protein 2 [Savitreella phatthalungensis]